MVRSYIAKQEAHHRRATFEEELVGLLRKHGIEFDPKYIFD
jgi:putative transposase